MTSQPDKLFRDKLENFQHPAPVGAWDKVSNNLSRSDRKITWLRIAAGIALITAVSIALWPAGEEKQRIAVKQDQTPVIKKDSVQQKAVPVQLEEQQTDRASLAKTEHPRINKQQPSESSVPEQHPVPEDKVSIPVTEQQELVAEVNKPEEKESSSVTIVYTTAEVNSKFLKKKLSPEATPQAEDASHMQKLIGLAYAAKNSDTGLANLRQKKDDILALNFGKKKGEN